MPKALPLIATAVVLGLVGLVIVGGGPGQDPGKAAEQVEALVETGKQQLSAGDAEGALATFGAALKLTPGVPALCFDAGRAAELAGRLQEAEMRYRDAITNAAPDEDPRYYLALGELLLRSKRAVDAITPLSRAVTLANTIASHRPYQDALRAAGRYDTAEKMYAERMAARPGDVDALYLYARLVKEPQGRAGVLRTALERDGEHFWSQLALGITYLDMGDPASALPHLQQAQRIDPPSAKAWFGLVRVHLALGSKDAAEAAAQQLAERHPGTSATREARRLIDSHQW